MALDPVHLEMLLLALWAICLLWRLQDEGPGGPHLISHLSMIGEITYSPSSPSCVLCS